MKFTRTALLSLAIGIFSLPATAAEKYDFDKSHTKILFYINHLGFSDSVGEFTEYDGKITFDEKKPEDSTLDITLKPTGIRTSSKELDGKLQTEKFFNSTKFPEIKFVSNKVKTTGTNTGEIEGTVTMLGVSKPAILKVKFNKADIHPYSKQYVAGFTASATIKRSDFGMNEYAPAVGDDVRIEINTEIVNLDRKADTDKTK